MDLDALRLMELFFSYDKTSLELVQHFFVLAIDRWPEVDFFPHKKQVSLGCPRPFCGVYPPRYFKDRAAHRMGLCLVLPERPESPRVVDAEEPIPGQWLVHLLINDAEDFDEEFWGWMEKSRKFCNIAT